jgi:hypothetical protein
MFLLKLIKFICKNKHISYIQASNQPNMIGPNGLSAQHNLLKGYQAVPRLRLRPGRLARSISFPFCAGPRLRSHLRLVRASTAGWPGRELIGKLPAYEEFGSEVRWELVVAFRVKFGLWTTWAAVELKLFSFLIIWAVEAIIGSRPARRKMLGPACISSHPGIVQLWKENQNV